MDSGSSEFILFGLTIAVISNISQSPSWRAGVLLMASILFVILLAANPMSLMPLAAFLLLGYVGLLLIGRGWPRSFLCSIFAVIVAYTWLKKYTIFPEVLFLRVPYLTLGLSYILFRTLHLFIEAREGNERSRIGFLSYILYMLNFTTFVSGPIQRYEQFASDQFTQTPVPLGLRLIGSQLERLVVGYFKVNILATLLDAQRQDAMTQMALPISISSRMAFAFQFTVIYPFFLYANFSGYIDIVIALARLMRLRLPENFDRPFSATSFLDFWNRWHITLSTWLKTYVYNPLLVALMRRTSSLLLQRYLGVFCFFVTFFLVGVWHGRTSEFAFFGVLQGGGVAINKLWQVWLTHRLTPKGYRSLSGKPLYRVFGRGLTFSWFAFSLFWFWAEWRQLDKILHALHATAWLGVWLAIWLGATVVLGIWESTRVALLAIRTKQGPVLLSRYAKVVYSSALILATVVITLLLHQSAPPIIYKSF